MSIDLKNMSVQQLESLSHAASKLANDLRKQEPSYDLALLNGVRDKSYPTVANGYVSKYSGEALITMADGRKWRAVGHGPAGDAYTVTRQGFIEFIPIDD